MNTTHDQQALVDPELDQYEDDGFGESLPVRPKRPFLTKWSAGLMTVAITAIGFYVGVEVEKGKTSTGGTSALAGAVGGTRSSSSVRAGGTGAPSGFGGAGASGTSGTVASVDGKTIYLKDSDGNTVKAKLSSGTTITKSEKVGHAKVYPGDSVVVTGSTSKNGVITATSLTDSGASNTSSASTSSAG